MMNKPTLNIEQLIERYASQYKKIVAPYLENVPSSELKSALEYVLWNGGKHLRPLLVYATGSIFQAPLEHLDIPAVAIELIHTYSLIHDDLPCMDNADFRRGKPACHKVFGEGIAVLTGDALLPLALQILATHPATLKPEKRLRMMQVLCRASGIEGMVAGQVYDISVMDDKNISNDLLIDIYRLKTGALFSASIEMGRLSSSDDDEMNQQALKNFSHCVGLAFQIQDDILDMEGTTLELGKPQGMDAKNHKTTYPSLHGLVAAKVKVESLYAEALESINFLGNKAQLLRELTAYILQRK